MGIHLELLGAFVILSAAIFAVIARDSITGGIVGLSITYALQVINGQLCFKLKLLNSYFVLRYKLKLLNEFNSVRSLNNLIFVFVNI